MKYDDYGQCYINSNELCDLLYKDPTLDISHFLVEDPAEFNASVKKLYADLPQLTQWNNLSIPVEDYHESMQENWLMPDEYLTMDIAAWLLDQCKTDAELQRVGTELLMFQERDLFNLLRFMKYLVDTLRKNNLVWGVGRGSSVASYVLYLIGVHKINSLYYDLDISEFLK
jgi:DNA polymerase III alpha subunit